MAANGAIRRQFAEKLGFTNALERKIQELERRITSSSESSSSSAEFRNEGQELGDLLKGILDNQMNMHKKTSNQPVESHFQELFEGLSTLSTVEKPAWSLLRLSEDQRVARIGELKSQETVLKAFDELYYHGQLSRRAASAILRNQALVDVSRILKLVLSGGTGLFKWSLSDKLLVRLNLAHKLLILKKREQARSLVIDSFDTLWVPSIQAQTVNSSVVINLGKALIAFRRMDLVNDLVLAQFHNRDQTRVCSQVYSVCLPLWQAALQMKKPECARQIITTSMQKLTDLDMQNSSETSVLIVNLLDILYHELLSSEMAEMQLDSFVIHRREEKTAVQLVELLSILAALQRRKLTMELMPMLEHYSQTHPHYDLFTARLRLLQLNLTIGSSLELSPNA